jgi:hypothetical protein
MLSIDAYKNMLPGVFNENTNNTALLNFFETFLEFSDTISETSPERINDIDLLNNEYIENFKNTFLPNIPIVNGVKTLSDAEVIAIIKNAIDLNRTKGTTLSIQYLFRALFANEIDIQFGRIGTSQVAKPLDFEVVETNSLGNPVVVPNYDKFSNTNFFFIDGQNTKSGSCVTYFKQYNENHIWVVSNDIFNENEILYFPSIKSYLKIKSTNRLNLDGWNGKLTREIDKNGFYLENSYNPIISKALFNEINNVTFVDQTNKNDYVTFTVTDGKLSFGIIKYPSSVQTYTFDVTGLRNSEQLHATIKYSIDQTGVTSIKINDIERVQDFINNTLQLYEYDMLKSDNTAAINRADYDIREGLISTFTIITRTSVSPAAYMNILRTTVIPAGFRLLHLYLITSMVTNTGLYKLYEGTSLTPTLKLLISTQWAIAAASIADYDNVVFNSKYYDYFYTATDLDGVNVGLLTPANPKYHSSPMYSVAASSTRPTITYSTPLATYTYDYNDWITILATQPIDKLDVLSNYDRKLFRINDMNIPIDTTPLINTYDRLYHIYYRSADITIGSS